MEIDDEIEKLIVVQPELLDSDASTHLLIRCFSGRVFCLNGQAHRGQLTSEKSCRGTDRLPVTTA